MTNNYMSVCMIFVRLIIVTWDWWN